MMLDVVTIVKEEPVVAGAVVTGRSPRMFVMAVQPAQSEAEQKCGEVGFEKETSAEGSECAPNECDGRYFQRQLSCHAQAPWIAAVMRQMPLLPKRLRNAGQRAEIDREASVCSSAAKERKVDEIVSDRVGSPPDSESDHPEKRGNQENDAVRKR